MIDLIICNSCLYIYFLNIELVIYVIIYLINYFKLLYFLQIIGNLSYKFMGNYYYYISYNLSAINSNYL